MGWQDAPVVQGARAAATGAAPAAAAAASGQPAWASAPQAEQPSFFGRLQEAVTGRERSTAETEALPDWATMPELNSFSLASFKAGLGTLLSNPQETVQVIQANFPGVQVRQDERGNFFLRSSIDGNEYAIKPGFRTSDIPRAVGAVAAFTPAGRAATIPGAAVAAGATQAAIEATQAATGGEFSPQEVAVATLTGGAVPAVVRAGQAGVGAVRQAIAGRADDAAAAVPPVAPTAPPPGFRPQPTQPAQARAAEAVPTTQPVPATAAPAAAADEVTATARTAAMGGFGSKGATERLAAQAAPDQETIAAAERLGILDNLQPDHYSTNLAYRQLAQLVKSQTGSPAKMAETEGLLQVAQRADDLITSIGGSSDLSALDAGVKRQMLGTVKQLEDQADKLYTQVRAQIPAATEAPAEFVLTFLKKRADDLGGEQNLSSMERTILRKLSPKPVKSERVPGIEVDEGFTNPTYALLDDVRRDVGAVVGRSGPFKDADSGLAKRLYELITRDQEAVVSRAGLSEVYDAAKTAVRVRKGIEDDLASLFGKNLDGSLVGDLRGAVRALPSGDVSKLVNLIRAVPEELRQQTVASGLSTFFQRTARGGEMDFAGFARWFEGLERNKAAFAAVMSNLPKHSQQQLRDLARVARGVSMSKGEFIATGKAINPKALEVADTVMGRVYDEVRRRGWTGLAAEGIGTATVGPGFASAIQTALNSNRPTIAQAADSLITSPQFVNMVRAQASNATAAAKQDALRRFAYSREFTRYARALGNPREMSNRERWVLQALQAQNQSGRER
jgi:hypothetical protein